MQCSRVKTMWSGLARGTPEIATSMEAGSWGDTCHDPGMISLQGQRRGAKFSFIFG
jgi:hypothetical protein